MGLFQTARMTLKHIDNTVVVTHKKCQLDTVNLPWNMEVGGTDPTDWYDLYTIGWKSPKPIRGDYFVDEKTGVEYSVFSTVFEATNSLQLRVTQYSGKTP
jgi:hypothetical protein